MQISFEAMWFEVCRADVKPFRTWELASSFDIVKPSFSQVIVSDGT